MPSISAWASGPGRLVRPERLDDLSPDDPRARRSRRDLQRVHRMMRSTSILLRAIGRLRMEMPPRRILELGAGDGALLARLASRIAPSWRGAELTLLDRHDLVTAQVRARFTALAWTVRVLRADALEWSRAEHPEHYDLCMTTLFLHHFHTPALRSLLGAIAARADSFIACEPRRNALARLGSRSIALLGANEVTRHDAVASVAAGFAARELSALWPASGCAWRIEEHFAWPFTHCFVARRSPALAALTQ